jgi:hypothetical protein
MNPIALLLPVGTDKKRRNCVEYTERIDEKDKNERYRVMARKIRDRVEFRT